jgi:hypothetical protein
MYSLRHSFIFYARAVRAILHARSQQRRYHLPMASDLGGRHITLQQYQRIVTLLHVVDPEGMGVMAAAATRIQAAYRGFRVGAAPLLGPVARTHPDSSPWCCTQLPGSVVQCRAAYTPAASCLLAPAARVLWPQRVMHAAAMCLECTYQGSAASHRASLHLHCN